jgi:hypothetical protein
MSKDAPIGLTIMEKLIGLLIIAIGSLWFYVTYSNLGSMDVSAIFLGLALALIVLGVFLLIAKFD